MDYLIESPIQCPYCLEEFTIVVDTSQGDEDTIEDCTVCCRPIHIRISASPGEVNSIDIERG